MNPIDNLYTALSINDAVDGSERTIKSSKICEALNSIFPNKSCTEVIYTRNTDKIMFGVYVNPVITPNDAISILTDEEPVEVKNYSVEIDSKLFDIGLSLDELVAYILFDVSNMILYQNHINNIREVIHIYQMDADTNINFTAMINRAQVFIFAIKDAMIKFSSLKYADSDTILSNPFINSDEDLRNSLIDAQNKVRTSVFGLGSGVKEPSLTLLQWALDLYVNFDTRFNTALETLKQSKSFTASKLLKTEIDKTINSMQRVSSLVATESTIIIQEAKNRGSLFANLKRNGLRAIEDDLYEYRIRAKNAETEEDAWYALKQINTRINMLEDYLYNETDLSESDYDRWRNVINNYRALRDELSTKKIVNKKNYGLFFDYDQLDQIG
ncbi:MAG: hypothetical protein NC548_15465 [Lachnospiraceae bacterium]|nr:hypothetical protein [Lachnospiraceae bacterium]MCM1235774.1 hypothetical protein [Ruminococcus flavefaciens]